MQGGTAKHDRKALLNPIIDWTDEDIWTYIRENKLPYCTLYDQGFKRIGCLFCPMSYWKRRLEEVKRYPKMAEAFRKSFNKLYELRKTQGKTSVDRWPNGDAMFYWWLTNDDDYTEEKLVSLWE